MTPTDQFVDLNDAWQLCYRDHGDPDHPALLLIAGLGQQLNAWPDDLCQAFVARGLRVVRFDNRDTGRSFQHPAPAPRPDQIVSRRFSPQQYTLDDMAIDTCALIDALGLAPVHLLGASMGGMIAQNVAARFPERVASLTSVMSSTGSPRSGRPAASTLLKMGASRPARDRQAFAESTVSFMRHIGSRGFPFPEEEIRDVALEAWDRNSAGAAYDQGFMRQLAAIIKSGDRSSVVRTIGRPTLVIHGDRDPMVHPSGGVATASAISAARLHTIAGMGHDLPVGAWPQLIDLVCDHVAQATAIAAQESA